MYIEAVGLDTFPDDDQYYCKSFAVPKDWLIDILHRLDDKNERRYIDYGKGILQNFLCNYVWEETLLIYSLAKSEDKLLCEKEEG